MIRRFRSLLVAAAALGASAAVAAAPAAADPVAQCTATRGAIVAVDFTHWNGPIVRGCGVGAASGYDLLHKGGFSTAGTAHDGPGFICRLGSANFAGGTQYPTSAEEACVTTPKSSSYWSYWVAPAGQRTWSYSKLGAMSDHPSDGEVEFWQFGATSVDGSSGQPTVTPAQLRAENSAAPTRSTPRPTAGPSTNAHRTTAPTRPTAATRSRPPSRTGGGTTGSRSSARTAARSQSSPAASASGSVSVSGPTSGNASGTGAPSTVTAVPGSGSTDRSTAPPIVDATASATAPPAPTSSPAPFVAGGALVALLGGGAGWTALRRRRAEK